MSQLQDMLTAAFQAFDEDRLDEAEALYHQCLVLVPDHDSDDYRHTIHMIAFVKSHQGDYAEATRLYTELRDSAHQRGDHIAEAVALHQLGMVERLAARYPAALDYLTQERQLLQAHFPQHWMHFSANSYEHGYIAFLMGDLPLAEDWMRRALAEAEQAADPVCRGCAQRGLGEISAGSGDFHAARQHFTASAAAFRAAGNEHGAAQVEALRAGLPSL